MKYLPTLFIGALLLSSCLDDPIPPRTSTRPHLPAATTRGANTFGALVNDTIWEAAFQPSQGIVSASPNALYRRRNLSVFGLRRSNVNSPAAYFDLELENINRLGTYALGGLQGPAGSIRYGLIGTLTDGVDYVTNDSTATGSVTITRLDTTGNVPYVSGRFMMRTLRRVDLTVSAATAAQYPLVVQVDSGRFDVQFNRP